MCEIGSCILGLHEYIIHMNDWLIITVRIVPDPVYAVCHSIIFSLWSDSNTMLILFHRFELTVVGVLSFNKTCKLNETPT